MKAPISFRPLDFNLNIEDRRSAVSNGSDGALQGCREIGRLFHRLPEGVARPRDCREIRGVLDMQPYLKAQVAVLKILFAKHGEEFVKSRIRAIVEDD